MSNQSDASRSRESGFTLAELVIAITVMAILSAVVIPAFRNYRHRAAVAAAQSAAHCLETALTTFDPYSQDPVSQLPIGISDDLSLFAGAQQLGCKLGPSAGHESISAAANFKNCDTWWYYADGRHVHQRCSDRVVPPDVEPHYELTLGVPNFPDRISISSMHAMETLPQ